MHAEGAEAAPLAEGKKGEDAGGTVVVEDELARGADPSETSANVTVVAVDARLAASEDVAGVVEQAAGTTVRRLGGLGDFAAVSIRGSSFRQVQVYLDGVPLNPDGSEAVNLSELPLSGFERVEVYRSGAPPEFAAAPIGGVVNLVTGELPQRLRLGLGSYDTSRLDGSASAPGPLAALGGPEDEVIVLAEAFATRGNFVYFDDNGTIYDRTDDRRRERVNNDKRQLSAHARWRLRDRGVLDELSLTGSFLSRAEGVPGTASTPAEHARLATRRGLESLHVQARPGAWKLVLTGWRLDRDEVYDDREGEVGTGSQWNRYQGGTTGLVVHAAWGAAPWLVPALTASARRESYVQEDLLNGLAEDPRRRVAGTAALSAELWAWNEAVRLSPVAQLAWLDNRALGEVPFGDTPIAPEGKATEVVPTPRLGLLVRPPVPGLALKANGGRFFRPPDLTELFGDRGGVIGNTDLVPERGWKADAGFRWALPADPNRGAVEGAWFWNLVDDQIIYVQNGQSTSVPVNFARAWTDGFELSAAGAPLAWLDGSLSLTWTRSRNLTPRDDVANKQLPRVPEWMFDEAVGLHWGERLRLGHTWTWIAGNTWDATNFFRAPPRSIHGLFLRLGTDRLSAEASVLNLFDRTVAVMDRNPLSDADDEPILQPINDFFGYPLPGRSFLFTLAWTG